MSEDTHVVPVDPLQIGAGSSETREEAVVTFLEPTVVAPQVIVGYLGAARSIQRTVGVQI